MTKPRPIVQAMIWHWLTIFDIPVIICSVPRSPFVGSWFKSMCKHIGISHAKTVAYPSRANGRAEVAGSEMFDTFCQLHIKEPGRNLFYSL